MVGSHAFATLSELLFSGEVCWGHDTGVLELNIKDFTDWTGTGTVSGSGDSEIISLHSGDYMESPTWNFGIGTLIIGKDIYASGYGAPDIYYKTGDSEATCDADTWTLYTGSPVACARWVKVRIEVT